MKLRALLLLASVALLTACEVIVFFDGGSGLDSAEEYYNASAGEGYLYQVSSGSGSGDVWVVGQEFSEGLGLGDVDFVVTMAPAGSGSGLDAYTLAGVTDFQPSGGGGSYTVYTAGLPVGDYADIYRIGHVFPSSFDNRADYSLDFTDRYGSVSYTLSPVADRTVEGTSYAAVIRVNASVTNSGSSTINGDGTFYYADGVGLIEASYETDAGETITFELKRRETFQEKTDLSGRVDVSLTSADRPRVTVGWANIGIWDAVESGDFYNLFFYGPSIGLSIGYDPDNDERLEYGLSGSASDPRTDILTNLSLTDRYDIE